MLKSRVTFNNALNDYSFTAVAITRRHTCTTRLDKLFQYFDDKSCYTKFCKVTTILCVRLFSQGERGIWSCDWTLKTLSTKSTGVDWI